MSRILAGSVAVLAFAWSSSAWASGPYVTIQDDGTVANALTNQNVDPTVPLMKLYAQTGLPTPQILSVWTTFPMDGEPYSTFFLPEASDILGIGLDHGYPKKSKWAPLEDTFFHNDVTKMAARASLAGAAVEGYAQYLFLLELSHKWCSSISVPATDAGSNQDLIGFPFHWSFWMDATGSPGGGNTWIDNGGGSYTIAPQTPSSIAFSKLDLYLMGLADKSEVAPFGVLEGAVPPAGVKDATWGGGAYSAESFPWFGTATFTATATSRRSITIDDVVAANGPRTPAFGTAPTSWTLGIVLLAKSTDSADRIAQVQAIFDPVASSLAPLFSTATHGRGTMNVVTAAPPVDDGGIDADTTTTDAGEPASDGSGGGCAMGSSSAATPLLPLLVGLGLALARRRARTREV